MSGSSGWPLRGRRLPSVCMDRSKKGSQGWKAIERRIKDKTVSALLHHVYGLRVLSEAESIATGGCPKIYGHDNREWAGYPGSDLDPLAD